MKGTKGITLIALVITIVIIIILSTIAINFTFGENGLITRAQQAAEMSEVSRILEQLEMAKGSAYIDGAGEIDPDHYFDILEEEGIINDKETDVVDNGDGTYDVTTEGDRVFEVTLEPNGDLDIEYIGKNNEPRISEIKVTDKTDTSVTVEVVTKNVENAEYTYSYKKTDESDWIEAGTDSSSTFTFNGLENNTSYDIKVTVKTGDTTIEKTITVQLGTGVVEIPDNTIIFGQVAWQGDGTASMEISTTESGYTLQYQIGGTSGEWTTITSGQSITGLKHGDTVYAKITDGKNDSEIQQTTIEDTIPPVVSVSSDGNTSSSINVRVQVADNQSGMSDSVTYTYYIKQSSEGDDSYQVPENAKDISENTYTFTGLTPNISYDIKVEVKSDKAGNMGICTLLNQTTGSIPGGEGALEDGSINIGEPTWSDGKASITVSTNTEYQIEYQVNGTDDGSWTTLSGDTISNLNDGDKVNIRLTDGTNHGEHVTKDIEDTVPPTVDVTSGGNTSNSVAVNVEANDNESGMADSVTYTYYIKQSSQGDENYQVGSGATDISQNTYTFTGLTQGTSYDVKVEVKADKAGNIGTGTLTNQTTTSIPGGEGSLDDGTIKVGDTVWADGKASITVSTESGYSIEYQINGTSDGSWNNIGNSGTVSELNYGDTVNIRLTDGTNHGDFVTVTIGDEIAPTVNVTLGTSTSNSIVVNVVATDSESGMSSNPTYTYYYKESSQEDGSYTAPEDAKDITANTYTFTGLKQNTRYDIKVEVKADLAGNMGTGTLLNQTTSTIPGGDSIVTDGTLTIGEPTWSSGKASITVSTNQSYQIEYQVNGTEGSWTTVSGGTISNLNHGDKVNIRLTDGQNSGGYVTKEIKDEVAPTVTVTSGGEPTSNSIAVSVQATDNESGMASSLTYTYYIKQSTQGDESYQAPNGATGITQNTYTFTGLQQGTSYDVKVEVTGDVAGNTGSGILLNQTTQSIPGGSEGVEEGAITFGAVNWSNGKASITVSTNTSYQIEYKLSNPEVDDGWTSIDNNGTISGLSHGNTVYARLTDGNNHGDYAVASIQDGVAPTVDVTASGAPTSNSISVNVVANDNESGMAASPTYTYYIKQSSEEDTAYVAKANNITENTYTFTGLQQGTSYDVKVEVTGDNAGNTGTGYLAGQTTETIPDGSGEDVEEGAITFGTVNWSNNKASISVSTNTSYQIEYQVGAITEGGWAGIANNGTISNLNYGDTVYARLTDGVNHGEYAAASITETIAPEASIEVTEITSDSITVKVTASDGQSGLATSDTYKYYLNSESSPRETSESDIYTYAELTGTTEYTLKVVVTDIAGNKKESTTTATTEQSLPEGWDGKKVTPVESADGITVPVPGGYTASSAAGENSVNDGFVIYEGTEAVNDSNVDEAKTTRNQFVWIPVDDISQIANKTNGVDENGRTNYQGKLYDFSETGVTEKTDYGQDTTTFREPDVVTGNSWGYEIGTEYDGRSLYLNILGLSSSSEFKTQLQEEFNEMIESVGIYGGFYIGRYEAGNLERDTSIVPVVVKGNDSIGGINWYYAYQNSKLIASNDNVVSTMIWGCLWDRTLIWLTETGNKNYSDLRDSRSWGNHRNSTDAAATNSGSKQATGTNEAWKANNIYDLSGNMYEWTMEASSTEKRILRGGSYNSNSSTNSVSGRYDYNKPIDASSSRGSLRSMLYIDIQEPEDGPTYTITTEIQDDLGNKVVIPGGFHIDKSSGTSVEEGIVIEDDSGNQFVWIPTGTYQTSTGEKTNNLSRRTFTSSGSTEITASNGDGVVGNYFYGEGDSRSIAYNQIGLFKDSVNKNGGFYIGRYELGVENVIKAGVTPYTNITRDQAKSQIEEIYNENNYVVSELISSYAWDTALNFICQTNSEGYTLATTRGANYGNMGTYLDEALNTGGYSADNHNNIHDFFGNCLEWTTEYYSVNNRPCVGRGGYYNDGLVSTSSRNTFYVEDAYEYVSARAQLYIKSQ